MVIHGFSWQYMVIHGYIWQYMAIHAKQRFEHGNLICIPRENNSTRVSPSTEFVVASSRTSAVRQNPKIDYGLRSLSRRILTKMLIFVWSRKLISRLICRTIPGYNLFRRDRGWLGRDKKKKWWDSNLREEKS